MENSLGLFKYHYHYFFKKQYSKNDKAIELESDGKDYSNVDFGEHVGDGRGIAEFKGRVIDKILGTEDAIVPYQEIYKLDFDKQEKKIEDTFIKNGKELNSSEFHKELLKLAEIGGIAGQGNVKSKYEGLYVMENEDIRNQIFDKKGNLHLDKFDPKNWKKVENSQAFEKGLKELVMISQKYYKENKTEIENAGEAKETRKVTVILAEPKDIFNVSDLEFALGETTIVGRVIINRKVPYLKYNLTDVFKDPADIKLEWGKKYDMIGPSRYIPLLNPKGLEE